MSLNSTSDNDENRSVSSRVPVAGNDPLFDYDDSDDEYAELYQVLASSSSNTQQPAPRSDSSPMQSSRAEMSQYAREVATLRHRSPLTQTPRITFTVNGSRALKNLNKYPLKPIVKVLSETLEESQNIPIKQRRRRVSLIQRRQNK